MRGVEEGGRGSEVCRSPFFFFFSVECLLSSLISHSPVPRRFSQKPWGSRNRCLYTLLENARDEKCDRRRIRLCFGAKKE